MTVRERTLKYFRLQDKKEAILIALHNSWTEFLVFIEANI
ncbi:MAG: hypothetical protein DID92_2727744124 [Candidatus Nitrotoga sp. SPKER]|nr:MAG: hypothetical protein DID92_2727744124 [Candidatus Nitrotoga sp. SPKER]